MNVKDYIEKTKGLARPHLEGKVKIWNVVPKSDRLLFMLGAFGECGHCGHELYHECYFEPAEISGEHAEFIVKTRVEMMLDAMRGGAADCDEA